jgi:hypothetical protein
MNKIYTIFFVVLLLMTVGCNGNKPVAKINSVIGQGQMPNLAKDKSNGLHLVYGQGDSIMYTSSVNEGNSFSPPQLVAVVAGMFSFASRGPQIACTNNGVTITACDRTGNIYSFVKDKNDIWTKGGRVNDVDTVAKEGLMALGGDANLLFAVWLDLRGIRRNKIEGASSTDGGKTWAPNMFIYNSPDSSVCECCKPSVVVKENNVYVMFRNSLAGNRDLYLIASADGGKHFNPAKKLGQCSWALQGCPMDGGGISVNAAQQVQTIWRRHDTIFSCSPAKAEVNIGKGTACAVENMGDKNVYAWNENGDIVCLLPNGVKQVVGKGIRPIIKAIDDDKIICVWENNSQVQAAVLHI